MISPKKGVMKHYVVEGGIILFKFNGFLSAFEQPRGLQDLSDIDSLPILCCFCGKVGFPKNLRLSPFGGVFEAAPEYLRAATQWPDQRGGLFFFHHKILVLYTRTCIYSIYMLYIHIYIYDCYLRLWDVKLSSLPLCLLLCFGVGWLYWFFAAGLAWQLQLLPARHPRALTGLIWSISLDQVSWLPRFEVIPNQNDVDFEGIIQMWTLLSFFSCQRLHPKTCNLEVTNIRTAGFAFQSNFLFHVYVYVGISVSFHQCHPSEKRFTKVRSDFCTAMCFECS